jgi:hypothetical protein
VTCVQYLNASCCCFNVSRNGLMEKGVNDINTRNGRESLSDKDNKVPLVM